MVAEKPSLARSLAEILSKKSCNRRKSMCIACDVYEWSGYFPALRGVARFKMTSVCGHVMALDFPAKYNRWDQVDPVSVYGIHVHAVSIRFLSTLLFEANVNANTQLNLVHLIYYLSINSW